MYPVLPRSRYRANRWCDELHVSFCQGRRDKDKVAVANHDGSMLMAISYIAQKDLSRGFLSVVVSRVLKAKSW